jgi:predicted permease
MMLRSWRSRLRYWLHSGERARLLREEMEAHLLIAAQDLMEAGMTEQDARFAARRRFGNRTLLEEESRRMWLAQWASDLAQDTGYAMRSIRKQPGFAMVAVLSAALGIGTCSLVFGLANFALLRQLPVAESSRLISVLPENLRKGKVGQSMSYPDFVDLRSARSFAGMTAFFPSIPAVISTGGEPQRYWGSVATANYFDVVRPAFAVGRGFDAASDGTPGEAPSVVLSYRLWQSRFGGNAALVGRTIELNRRKVTVAGVTGPGFQGTESMFFTDFWVPFSMLDSLEEAGWQGGSMNDRGSQWLSAVGRLRPLVSPSAAASEIGVIGKRLSADYPATNTDRAFRTERAGQLNPGIRKLAAAAFAMLLLVAALVLCTACANVANLLLARASARRREFATRLAIGAGRGRLVRQLLTESALLALAGGAAGFALAWLGAAAISKSQLPISLPVDLTVSLDYRVMLFSTALAVFTGVSFGLLPALRATRPDLTGALKGAAAPLAGLRRFGLRNLLVVAQVAICVVLLVCSGLFVRSLRAARKIELGFAHRNIVLAAFDPSLNRYSPAQTRRILDRLLDDVRAIPGIESVSLGDSVPLNLEGTQNMFVPKDQPAGAERSGIRADIYSVAPGFFATLGIRQVSGTDFPAGAAADDLVILNQAAAATAFPNQDPAGRRISYLGRSLRIAGVVQTTKSRTIGEDPHPCLYLPLNRAMRGNDSLTGMTLVLRTKGDPAGFTRAVREAARRIDPTLAMFDIRTMDTQVSRALYLPRATALLFGLTGLAGLFLATIGLFGVVSFAVARRTAEIGMRVALGATRARVLGMILRQGLALTAAGTAIGLALALAVTRITASLLYGVRPADTITFLAVPLFLAAVATGACLIPARRAARLDPMRALRCE